MIAPVDCPSASEVTLKSVSQNDKYWMTTKQNKTQHNHVHNSWYPFISSAPGQNGGHFAYNIFRGIFVNEDFCILIKISLKFVHKGPIDNNPGSV